jgi:hypothetical protein
MRTPTVVRADTFPFYVSASLTPGGVSDTIEQVSSTGVVSLFANLPISNPFGLAFDSSGNLYVVLGTTGEIGKITPGGVVSLFATVPGPLSTLSGLARDSSDNLYVSQVSVQQISKITPGGVVSLFATLSGGSNLIGLAFDSSGNLYAVENSHARISKITSGGVVSTFATGIDNPRFIAFAVDSTSPQVSCGASDGVWHDSDVSIACTASDPESGLANAADDAAFSLITNTPIGTETANAATDSREVCNKDGGCTTAGPISGNKVDKKPPTITITSPAASATYQLNASVGASYACVDGGSGVASCQGPVANASPIDTSSVGTKTFTVNSTDTVGNPSTLAVTYTVVFTFTGFFSPVNNLPALNSLKAGSAVPVKFSLSGNQGLNIMAAGYPASVGITCDSTALEDAVEETVTAGSSSLTYDPSTDQYIYVWKTNKAWTGCRQLVIKLTDGTYVRANFKLK